MATAVVEAVPEEGGAGAGYDPELWRTEVCHYLWAGKLNAVGKEHGCFVCGVPGSACSTTDGVPGTSEPRLW
jgi:hypothetical protein